MDEAEGKRRMLTPVCPVDRTAIVPDGAVLLCERGHLYRILRGIPVLVIPGVRPTSNWNLDREDWPEDDWRPSQLEPVHPAVQIVIAATGGRTYRNAVGRLRDYPIPELRLPAGGGRRLLDIGCAWGRWTIAAARSGYQAMGIDPDLGLIFTARRVAEQLGMNAEFVAADARHLPFPSAYFDCVFSYSVIQHFSKSDAHISLAEIGRVLKPGGIALIQMPNKYGLRNAYSQMKQQCHDHGIFAVRYWAPSELICAFERHVGPTTISADCFFGLGIQASDIPIVSACVRPVVRTSETLRRLSVRYPSLTALADSLYLQSRRQQQ